MKPLENKPTKICPCCKVKKDLEIGFDKDSSSSSGYHSWCKICKGNAQKERKHKKKDYIFERHLWGKEDEKNRESVCLRCGLIRKRIPDKWKVGIWYNRYWINKEWIKEKQICFKNKKL